MKLKIYEDQCVLLRVCGETETLLSRENARSFYILLYISSRFHLKKLLIPTILSSLVIFDKSNL